MKTNWIDIEDWKKKGKIINGIVRECPGDIEEQKANVMGIK